MRKPARKPSKKTRKSDFEDRFALMVGEYQSAKEVLDSLPEGTSEHAKQKKSVTLYSQTQNDSSIQRSRLYRKRIFPYKSLLIERF